MIQSKTLALVVLFIFIKISLSANNHQIDTQYGSFSLEEAPLYLNIPEGFMFIDGKSSRDILINYYGSKKDAVEEVVGMIIPDTTSTTAYLDKKWIIAYHNVGHVIDSQMEQFSFKELMQRIRDDIDDKSIIVGWAWTPKYDSISHRLSLPLMFIHGSDSILGHKQFIFGKDGVVKITPYAPLKDIQWLYDNDDDIANSIVFNSGNSYEDFNPQKNNATYSSVYAFLYNQPNKTIDTAPLISSKWFISFGILLCLMLLLYIGTIICSSKKISSKSFSLIVINVLLRLGIFFIGYIFSIVLGIFLIYIGFQITNLCLNHHIEIFMIISLICMWIFIITYTIFIIKPIFQFSSNQNPNSVKIDRDDAPQLFSLLEETTNESGIKMPKKVFVSTDVNACVFYNTSFWNIIFPVRKNIEIGLGLLFGLNQAELKAIIAHEFGHFGQGSMRIGSMVSIGYNIARNLVTHRDWLDNWIIKLRLTDTHWILRFTGYFMIKSTDVIRFTMNKLFRYVQKGYMLLSKQMEYDADNVSANIVGNNNAISALCKTEVISERFQDYNSLLTQIAQSKKILPKSYWAGYELFLTLCDNLYGFRLSAEKQMTEHDLTKTESRVQLENPWVSHPTTTQRIEQIKSINRIKSYYNNRKAIDIVSTEVYDFVSSNHLINTFDSCKIAQNDEYIKLITSELNNNSFPLLLRPFFNRTIFAFNIDEVQNSEFKINPFNEVNASKIQEFTQAVTDYQTMLKFKEKQLDVKELCYDGVVYSRKNIPMEKQLAIVRKLEYGIKTIDIDVYLFVITHSRDPEIINMAYDNIFYSQSIIREIREKLFNERTILHNELTKITRRDHDEFIALQMNLRNYLNNLKSFISNIEMKRLYPIIPVEIWEKMTKGINDEYLFLGSSISSNEINYVFSTPEELISLFENLAFFSKKIITDTLSGKIPRMYYENSMTSAKYEISNNSLE